MSAITPIQVEGTKRPAGHYSQAVVHAGVVYVAGQLPMNLETGAIEAGSIEAQTELALRNVGRILEAAGSGLKHALQMTIFITDMENWPRVNEVYARIMGDARPARAVVPVLPLHYGVGIEITCIAAVAS